MKLFLVRHAQSVANIDRSLYYKFKDHEIELSTYGKKQAEQVGIKFKEMFKSYKDIFEITIVTSPFVRAVDTAKAIYSNLKDFNVKLIEDPLICELYLFPNIETRGCSNPYTKEGKDFHQYWYKINNTESIHDVYMRARQFYLDLRVGYYKSSNLVIVTHEVFIKCFLAVIEHKSIDFILDEEIYTDNCEIIEVTNY